MYHYITSIYTIQRNYTITVGQFKVIITMSIYIMCFRLYQTSKSNLLADSFSYININVILILNHWLCLKNGPARAGPVVGNNCFSQYWATRQFISTLCSCPETHANCVLRLSAGINHQLLSSLGSSQAGPTRTGPAFIRDQL